MLSHFTHFLKISKYLNFHLSKLFNSFYCFQISKTDFLSIEQNKNDMWFITLSFISEYFVPGIDFKFG